MKLGLHVRAFQSAWIATVLQSTDITLGEEFPLHHTTLPQLYKVDLVLKEYGGDPADGRSKKQARSMPMSDIIGSIIGSSAPSVATKCTARV